MSVPKLERVLYAQGMTPREARRCTLRDAFQVARGYAMRTEDYRGDRITEEVFRGITKHLTRHFAQLSAVVANFGGMKEPKRPLSASDFVQNASEVFGETHAAGMSRERLEANYERHEQRQNR